MSAQGYRVTTQREADEYQPDGTYMPVIEVGYQTTAEPPVHGTVSVPRSIADDPQSYADAVKVAIEARVAAHHAASQLGRP